MITTASIATRFADRSLQGLDTNARVIYIGTFSKVLFPIIAPRLCSHSLRPHRSFSNTPPCYRLCPPSFYQEWSRTSLTRAFRAPHSKNAGSLPRAKECVGGQHQQESDPAEVLGVSWYASDGDLPNRIRDLEIAELSRRQNFGSGPLPFLLGRVSRSGFIWAFGSTAAADIPAPFAHLRNLLTTK